MDLPGEDSHFATSAIAAFKRLTGLGRKSMGYGGSRGTNLGWSFLECSSFGKRPVVELLSRKYAQVTRRGSESSKSADLCI